MLLKYKVKRASKKFSMAFYKSCRCFTLLLLSCHYKTVKFRIKYALVPGNLICIPIFRHVASCFSVLAYTHYEGIIHALEQPHEPYIYRFYKTKKRNCYKI